MFATEATINLARHKVKRPWLLLAPLHPFQGSELLSPQRKPREVRGLLGGCIVTVVEQMEAQLFNSASFFFAALPSASSGAGRRATPHVSRSRSGQLLLLVPRCRAAAPRRSSGPAGARAGPRASRCRWRWSWGLRKAPRGRRSRRGRRLPINRRRRGPRLAMHGCSRVAGATPSTPPTFPAKRPRPRVARASPSSPGPARRQSPPALEGAPRQTSAL
mmetsp:Transcript_87401/g.280344  ORF Transcript_87401/g.280344 Transcript_87401/m.280344 type:complete len:218 (+) Transcript_87401:3906-4559(+)